MLRHDVVAFLDERFSPTLAVSAALFFTGEIGYHSGVNAAESGLARVVLGHRKTERPFVDHGGELLRRVPDLTVEER